MPGNVMYLRINKMLLVPPGFAASVHHQSGYMRQFFLTLSVAALSASPAWAAGNAVPEADTVSLLALALAGVIIGRRLSSRKTDD